MSVDDGTSQGQCYSSTTLHLDKNKLFPKSHACPRNMIGDCVFDGDIFPDDHEVSRLLPEAHGLLWSGSVPGPHLTTTPSTLKDIKTKRGRAY